MMIFIESLLPILTETKIKIRFVDIIIPTIFGEKTVRYSTRLIFFVALPYVGRM